MSEQVLTNDNVILSLRIGEGFAIYEREAPGRYAIALIEALEMPGAAHEACRRIATIAAYCYHTLVDGETAWGWVHLMPATKRILSEALVDIGAEVGRWYFVEMGDSDD